MSHATRALELLRKHVGREDGVSEWLLIDQQRIDDFADATLDHQFIHVDPERAAIESPYGATIAHGFLTLSLVVHLSDQIPLPETDALEGMSMGVNYGLDRVRFPAPVLVGQRIRVRRTLAAVDLVAPLTLQQRQVISVEIEGGPKPACVAEILMRMFFVD